MREPAAACPECATEMQPIKLVDATDKNYVSASGIGHVELKYAAADAKASFFTGRVPVLGSVKGMICPKCGRIVLRGEPQASS